MQRLWRRPTGAFALRRIMQMISIFRIAVGLLAAASLGLAGAQPAPANASASVVLPAATPAAASVPKVASHITVIEDDNARIEESRVRGAVQRVTVQSKIGGVRPYEIQVAPAGRDPSRERGNAGRSAWSVLDF